MCGRVPSLCKLVECPNPQCGAVWLNHLSPSSLQRPLSMRLLAADKDGNGMVQIEELANFLH